eukprot:TRINITY_DN11684_c0_g1_i5.p1 TRINITY_DN11684_c0_g1~~TRINITY_DN11684_c0_g1_i5.p1  ORF type:complete len:454 (+),score=96.40 TRINITY_DN11684_c0_g1_i5:47-1408(+)
MHEPTLLRFLKGKIISPQGLENLSTYGYHGVDHSFFGNLVLNHYWNWAVQKLPMWLAPNILTVLGLLCNITGYLVMSVYSPTFSEEVPRWSFFVAAALIFAYQTLDNLDGKQARRTKSSSPLGELMDHGCDALSVILFSMMVGASIRIGEHLVFYSAVAGFIPFYAAHWEEYFSGSLVLGKFNGPTEAQLIFIVILIAGGIGGPNMWITPLNASGTFRLHHILFIITLAMAVPTLIQNMIKVYKVIHGRDTSFIDSLMYLAPVFMFVFLILAWVNTSSLLTTNPHLTLHTLGLIFAFITVRLIIHRVVKEPADLFHYIFIALALASINSIASFASGHEFLPEPIVLYILFGISFTQFAFLSVGGANQLASYLQINIFRIPYPPLASSSDSGHVRSPPLLTSSSSHQRSHPNSPMQIHTPPDITDETGHAGDMPETTGLLSSNNNNHNNNDENV